MRWLVRFGYEGTGRDGWARQPGRTTVEGTVLRGLRSLGLDTSDAPAHLEVASRTDRGVSARANALALTSRLPAPALLRALNGIAPDLWFTDAAEVPSGFRVRHAERRVYRYFETGSGRVPASVRAAARLFRGPIDVRSFGREIARDAPVRRTVESVTVAADGGGWTVEARAPSFVWGMVRKIVSALREVEQGRLARSTLAAALHGEVRLTLPLAEPEPLVLWEVEYPVPWTTHWRGPNRRQSEWMRTQAAASRARSRRVESMAGRLPATAS
jgi:tRNA pseudouridine38-40 synthase